VYLNSNIIGSSMDFTHILLCCSNSSTSGGKSRFGYDAGGSLDSYVFSCGGTNQYYVSSTGSGSTCLQSSACLSISTVLEFTTEFLFAIIISGRFDFICFLFVIYLYLYIYNIVAHFQMVIRQLEQSL
jgi:hypothetical protein